MLCGKFDRGRRQRPDDHSGLAGRACGKGFVLRIRDCPTEDQGHRGRGGDADDFLSANTNDRIREQFDHHVRGRGFDAKRDIAGIVLNRWGHAYCNPQPGFFFGKDGKPAPREVLRSAPFGRIAFANTDLAGAMDHRFSILEAHRAVGQLWIRFYEAKTWWRTYATRFSCRRNE